MYKQSIVLLSLCSISLFGYDLKLSIGEDNSSDLKLKVLSNSIPNSVQLNEEMLKGKLQKDVLLTKKYLTANKLTDENIKELEYIIERYLSSKYEQQIRDEFFEQNKDIVQSYYNSNIDRYKIGKSFDFYVVNFEKLDDANLFIENLKKNGVENILKDKDYYFYKNIDINTLPDGYKVNLNSLKKLEPSKAIDKGERFEVIFYENSYEAKTLSFEEVKPIIQNHLFNMKKNKILENK